MAGWQSTQPPTPPGSGSGPGTSPHEIAPRGLLATTSSVSTEGRFGRMLRQLPVFTAKADSMIVLGASMLQAIENGKLDEPLGTPDDDENTSVLSNGELRLPAGY